jgi:hypothetical protein
MPSTVTLAQYAMLEKHPLKKGIMLGIAQEGVVADIFSWRSTGGALSESGVRFDAVNEPDWLALGGAITTRSVQGKQLSYSVYQMALHIDVPRLLDTQNATQLERQSTQQMSLAIKGAAYKLNDTFINGDQSSDANSFEGINKLVGELASSQSIDTGDITIATHTDAHAYTFIQKLHLAMHRVEGHLPTAAFANSETLLALEHLLMRLQLRGDDHDWVERALEVDDPRRSLRTASTKPAFVYRKVPFYDLGVKADQTTNVMLNTYTEGSQSGDGSRIFFIKQSPEDLEGLSVEMPSFDEIGLLEDTDVLRWRLKATYGLANWGPRSISKLYGFTAA